VSCLVQQVTGFRFSRAHVQIVTIEPHAGSDCLPVRAMLEHDREAKPAKARRQQRCLGLASSRSLALPGRFHDFVFPAHETSQDPNRPASRRGQDTRVRRIRTMVARDGLGVNRSHWPLSFCSLQRAYLSIASWTFPVIEQRWAGRITFGSNPSQM
jgi:hypothetical protein